MRHFDEIQPTHRPHSQASQSYLGQSSGALGIGQADTTAKLSCEICCQQPSSLPVAKCSDQSFGATSGFSRSYCVMRDISRPSFGHFVSERRRRAEITCRQGVLVPRVEAESRELPGGWQSGFVAVQLINHFTGLARLAEYETEDLHLMVEVRLAAISGEFSDIRSIARSIFFRTLSDALCVCGLAFARVRRSRSSSANCFS